MSAERPKPDLLDLVPVAASEKALRNSQLLDENGVPVDRSFSWDQLLISQELEGYTTDQLWDLASDMHVTLSPSVTDVLLGLHEAEEGLMEKDPALLVPALGLLYRREIAVDQPEPCPDPDGKVRVLLELTGPPGAAADDTSPQKRTASGRKVLVAKREDELMEGPLAPAPPPPSGGSVERVFTNRPAVEPFLVRVITSGDAGSISVQVDGGEERQVGVEEGEGAEEGPESLRVMKLWGLEGRARPDLDPDVILLELKQSQAKLLDLTRKNMGVARRLKERMDAAYAATLSGYEEAKGVRDMVGKYRALVARKEQERLEEEARMLEEDFSSCAVCSSGDSASVAGRNPIVFCDKCGLAVHQRCYRIAVVPAGEWLCKSCEDMRARGKEKDPPPVRSCVLCPNKGGAFVPTECKQWVHAACAIWMGLLDEEGHVPAIAPRIALLRRRYLDIYRCAARGCCNPFMGGLVACMEPSGKCTHFFHVTCGRNNDQEMYQGQLFGDVAWRAFCHKHSDNHRHEHYKREIEGKQEVREEGAVLLEISPQYLEVWDDLETISGRGAGKRPMVHNPGFQAFDQECRWRKGVEEDVDRKRSAALAAFMANGPPPPATAKKRGPKPKAQRAAAAAYANGYAHWNMGPSAAYANPYAPPGSMVPAYGMQPTGDMMPNPYFPEGMGYYPQPGAYPSQSVYPGNESSLAMYGQMAMGMYMDPTTGGLMWNPYFAQPAPPVAPVPGSSPRGSSPRGNLRDGYECHGCGALFQSSSNLCRHMKESCVVLVHKQARPTRPPPTKMGTLKAAHQRGGPGDTDDASAFTPGVSPTAPSGGAAPFRSVLPAHMWAGGAGAEQQDSPSQPPPPTATPADEGKTNTPVTDVTAI